MTKDHEHQTGSGNTAATKLEAEPAYYSFKGSERTNTCIICDGKYISSRLPGLFQCSQCGFITADLSISDQELKSLYGKDYFHGDEYLDYIQEQESLRLNFRNRLKTLQKFVRSLSSLSLFEIGCAYGFFLQEVRQVVQTAFGIDISEDATHYASETLGVDAKCGDYLKLELKRKVDIITMWDTIEHLARPDLFIEKASQDVRQGGIIAITTGDIDSFNARVQGPRWRMIHPPTHMHYFSVSTLTRLLKKHGFEVVHTSHPGNSRTLRSVAYFILAIQMKNKRLYDKLSKMRILNLRLTVNLFDIMYVIAKRR